MRKIKRDIVSALIFSKDGKLFQGMKHPKEGGVYSGKANLNSWHIPGGGIEENEDKISALIREIKEETGIDISSYKIKLVDDTNRGKAEKILKDTSEKVICEMKFNTYKVVVDDKNAKDINIELNDDLYKYKWVGLNELKSLKLTPPSKRLFKKLGYID